MVKEAGWVNLLNLAILHLGTALSILAQVQAVVLLVVAVALVLVRAGFHLDAVQESVRLLQVHLETVACKRHPV